MSLMSHPVFLESRTMMKSLWVPVSSRPVLVALCVLTLSLAGCKAKTTSFTFVNGTASPVDFSASTAFGTLTHDDLQPAASATTTFPCRRPGAGSGSATVTVSGEDCNGEWSLSSNSFPVTQGGLYTSTITSEDDGTDITYTLTVSVFNPKTGSTTIVSTTTTTTESCEIIID
jgi:hypothetical protein